MLINLDFNKIFIDFVVKIKHVKIILIMLVVSSSYGEILVETNIVRNEIAPNSSATVCLRM